MAGLIKWWKGFRETLAGQILLGILYAAMLALILICFTGHGQFVYELQ